MSTLRFRHVDADASDDVRTWPYEALVTALDRGLVADWAPLFAELRRAPWGEVARRLRRHLDERDADAVSVLFGLALDRARSDAQEREGAEVARRITDAVARSGLTQAAFAERIGTSASRLSTYMSGKVTPSASMLIRIEAVGRDGDDRPDEGRTPSTA